MNERVEPVGKECPDPFSEIERLHSELTTLRAERDAAVGEGERLREENATSRTGITTYVEALAASNKEITNLRAVAKALTDAIREVRPLGGSELFTRFDENTFYADPVYCGEAIKQLKADLHNARVENAVMAKNLRAQLSQRSGVSEEDVAVEDSCGCVFCDLDLEPEIVIDGVYFHHVKKRGNVLCERKSALAVQGKGEP